MEDPHKKIHETIRGQMQAKAERPTDGISAAFFWDLLQPEKKTVSEVFGEGGDLDRKPMYEELLGRTQDEHDFNHWLPPKIKLSFTAAFERDCYFHLRDRTSTFLIARGGSKRRADACDESIDSLKRVTES